jgi:NitT/TauT family transport system permease protein
VTFQGLVADGDLWHHTRTTLSAVLLGLASGLTVGVSLGYLIAKSPLLEDLLSPLIVAFQSTPVVAYVPLLIIWFGSGIQSKVIICALIVFFPMLMNTVVGIRGVPQDLRALMRVSRATPWQVFTKLEVPAAMPVLLTGLKTSATLSVIGAVVGEFLAANAGLGFLINQGRASFRTDIVFAAIITLALIAGLLYNAVTLLERRILAWQQRSR